ncbi:hypothetical protein PV646_13350 [Streptomyces sp. ID05-26A]|nr:hypothetical protein [Streptomyces sp. ID05-26A]
MTLPELDRFVDLARSWIANGAGHDEVLARLRQRGAGKIECMRVVAVAAGMSLGKAKVLVHQSPVWDDRRASDEAFQEWLFHGMFVLAVLGESEITAPAEDVARCEEHRRRATAQLADVAASLPDGALDRYRELMDRGLLGRAFAVLVAVVREQGADRWPELAVVAGTLLLDDGADTGGDDEDWARAAFEVRGRLSGDAPQ